MYMKSLKVHCFKTGCKQLACRRIEESFEAYDCVRISDVYSQLNTENFFLEKKQLNLSI